MLGRSTTAVQSALNRKVGGSNPPVPAKSHGASVYWLWTLPSQGSEGGFDSHKPYHFLFLCGVTVYRSGPLPFKQLMVGSTPTDATKHYGCLRCCVFRRACHINGVDCYQ